MAEMATNIGVQQRTVQANVAIARGLRAILNASGTFDVADATVRGDMVAAHDIAAAAAGAGYSLSGGGKVPAVAATTVAVGDLAYSAAAGKFTNVSTNAVYLGKWALAAAANALGEVELESVQ